MDAVTNLRRRPLMLLLAVVAGFAVARLADAAGWGATGISLGALLLIAAMVGAFAIADARPPGADLTGQRPASHPGRGPVASSTPNVRGGRSMQTTHSGGQTVLVADEDAPTRGFIADNLQADGFRVLVAADLAEARARLARGC